MQIELNAYVRKNHVPDIECLKSNMKERIRPVYIRGDPGDSQE